METAADELAGACKWPMSGVFPPVFCGLEKGHAGPHDYSLQLGATGRYPQGRLGKGDQGELRAAVTAARGEVFLHYGKDISWLSLPPDSAREMAAVLLKMADRADEQRLEEKRRKALGGLGG